MNLDERDLKKIKSLHVMLKMPIWILEKETNKVLKSYESIYKHPISYGFKEKNISEETVQFYSGILNEIFLCLWYKDIKIVIMLQGQIFHMFIIIWMMKIRKICQKPSVGNIMKRFRYIRWGISEII